MRGLQLSQLDTDYSKVEGQLSSIEATIKSKEEALETLKELEREAKNRLAVFQRSAAIEAKVKKLQSHFVWSQYKAQEEVRNLVEVLLTNRLLTRMTRKFREFLHVLKLQRNV